MLFVSVTEIKDSACFQRFLDYLFYKEKWYKIEKTLYSVI